MDIARYRLGYKHEDRKMLVVAVIFLIASATFFSYQIIGFLSTSSDDGKPAGPDSGQGIDVNERIVMAKSSLEGIGEELNNLAGLLE